LLTGERRSGISHTFQDSDPKPNASNAFKPGPPNSPMQTLQRLMHATVGNCTWHASPTHGGAIIGVGGGPGIGIEALLHKLLGRFGEAVKIFKQISAKDREIASVTDIGVVGLRWVESWREGKDICVKDFRTFESSGSLVLVSRFSARSPTPPPLSITQLRFSVLDKGSFNLVPVPHTVTFSSTTSGERAILQPHITLPPRKEIFLFDFSFSSLRSHQGSHRHPPAATVTLLQLLSLSLRRYITSAVPRERQLQFPRRKSQLQSTFGIQR
jgi:hypothetical protein